MKKLPQTPGCVLVSAGAERRLAVEYRLSSVCNQLPTIECLPDGRFHVVQWSDEEPETTEWFVAGMRFYNRFGTYWVEHWAGGAKAGEAKMQPLDWFFLRHICQYGNSKVIDILEALAADPDFLKYGENYFPSTGTEKRIYERVRDTLEKISAGFGVSRNAGRFELDFYGEKSHQS
ncbi:MAG: hypothetical protein LBQ54_14905 [Planctomycetaceae bacterium]|nr:hypothetical protein [Planctomycetaceae bacterium]